jgi:transglutaminase-like putative cysteine protease
MRRCALAAAVVFLGLVPAGRAGEVAGQVVRETWHEVTTAKGKLGYLHFQAREVTRDGKPLIRTTIREITQYLRSGDPYKEVSEQQGLETPAGDVVEVYYKSQLSKQQYLRVRGRPEGKDLFLEVLGEDDKTVLYKQKVPWDPAARGLLAQDKAFEGVTFKVGQTLEVNGFNSTINRAIPSKYAVKKVGVAGEGGPFTELEMSYARELYLSKSTVFVDGKGQSVKLQQDSPLFGLVTYQQTTKEAATAPFQPKVTDIEAPIHADKPIPLTPRPPKELVVRIRMEGDDDPGTLFQPDARQEKIKADNTTAELRLTNKTVVSGAGEAEPGPEYRESNFYIRSDDADVKKRLKEAIGDEANPRRQLRAIRKWVGDHVKGNYEVAFATADEVARTLEGDCSEMGVLAAAMCRAQGFPSRVCFGLVYDPENKGFGGHLWTEVWVDGHWETLDPTGVIPALGAAFLKVGAYSLAGVINPDEIVGLRRAFAGKMDVEILERK